MKRYIKMGLFLENRFVFQRAQKGQQQIENWTAASEAYTIPYCLDERYYNFIQLSWLGLIYACVDLNEECWALFRPPIQISIFSLSRTHDNRSGKKRRGENFAVGVKAQLLSFSESLISTRTTCFTFSNFSTVSHNALIFQGMTE